MEWLGRGRPTLGTLDTIAESLLRALATAHGRGVVHPGLSPSHVRVHDDDGYVYVTITRPDGHVPRDPAHDAYRAPESRDGSPPDHPRADVWAAGCILRDCVGAHGPDDIPPRMRDAVAAALVDKPAQRPSDAGALLGIWRGVRGATNRLPSVRGAHATIAGVTAVAPEPPPAPPQRESGEPHAQHAPRASTGVKWPLLATLAAAAIAGWFLTRG